MEDTLRGNTRIAYIVWFAGVLILVLMEDTLRVSVYIAMNNEEKS